MKRFSNLGELRLDEKELKTDLGYDRNVFVCSSCDMFHPEVPTVWISRVLEKIQNHTSQTIPTIGQSNRYHFQTKNPEKYLPFLHLFPFQAQLSTTIESDIGYGISGAPDVTLRADALANIRSRGFITAVSIEPVFDFTIDGMLNVITRASPSTIMIGAESKGLAQGIPEPSESKLLELIGMLRAMDIRVYLKSNLKRLMPGTTTWMST